MSVRPAAIWSALLACLLAVLALAPSRPGEPNAPKGAARGRGRPVRAALERRVRRQTPTLWRLAGQGSVANLVDYAVKPLTCPADGWLTLNAGARAQSDHTNAACGAFPAVQPAGAGATVPGLPALETYNHQFHNNPDWGLLSQQTPGCATAVGPGAALALADRAGHVASYLPGPGQVTAAVLARCPLTVVDLGTLGYAERARQLAAADAELARIAAALPADTTLLVTAPGAPSKPPHLQLALVDGPGYSSGLLNAASTRQPGLVVLTDLTPTVLGWLGQTVPPQTVGAHITRGDRGSLAATIQSLTGRDTAEQVWRDTHGEFFWAYALVDAVVLAAIGLASWGAARGQAPAPGPGVAGGRGVRRRGARGHLPGQPGALVDDRPPGRLAVRGLGRAGRGHRAGRAARLPQPRSARAVRRDLPVHPGRAGDRRDDRVAAAAGDPVRPVRARGRPVLRHRQRGARHLRHLRAVRRGLAGPGPAAQPCSPAAERGERVAPAAARRRRSAVLAVAAVAVFAVFASGWPGFGGKVGGTIAMVPCFLLLAMAVAGIRLNWRRVLLVAVSGLALFAVFALISYLVPATGHSDIGVFAGNTLHGRSGGLLLRKINSNLGSLSVNAFSPLSPIAVIVTGLMLWRPAWFRLTTAPLAFAAEPPMGPLLRPVLGVLWLMPVLGWLADDSGVIVPATALPFALPLGIAILAAAAYHRTRHAIVKAPPRAPRLADSDPCNISCPASWPGRSCTPSGGRR